MHGRRILHCFFMLLASVLLTSKQLQVVLKLHYQNRNAINQIIITDIALKIKMQLHIVTKHIQ